MAEREHMTWGEAILEARDWWYDELFKDLEGIKARDGQIPSALRHHLDATMTTDQKKRLEAL